MATSPLPTTSPLTRQTPTEGIANTAPVIPVPNEGSLSPVPGGARVPGIPGNNDYELQPIVPKPTNAVDAGAIVPDPQKPEDVGAYLDDVQDSLTGGYKSPFAEGSEERKLYDDLSPGDRPEVPNLVDEFEKQRIARGMEEIEKGLADLEAQRMEAEARLRARSQSERGKAGVNLGVIEGRVGQVERQERENIDFINRQISTKAFQLQIANDLVKNIMDLTAMDYNNAVQDYNARLSENIQIYEMVEDKRRFEMRLEFEKEQAAEDKRRWDTEFAEKVKRADENMARANVQIYIDLLTSGSKTWESLTDSERSQINKLEVQAGLPIGFVQGIKIAPSETIKHMNVRTDASGTQYLDILIQNADGSFTTRSERMGSTYQSKTSTGGGGTGGGYTPTQFNRTASILKGYGGDSKVLSQQNMTNAVNTVKAAYRLTDAQARDLVYAAFEAGGYKYGAEGAAKTVGNKVADSVKNAISGLKKK
ncbi:MAG TPA: hypothetical protein PK863_01970 [Candidatus Dojkabacteria bacterium]|nr:hypothetical protein [Candidatus Dojkabacteria bacterium]HRP50773.1 hypothetical protein [Candidatus Dojkabacteria bacterium]